MSNILIYYLYCNTILSFMKFRPLVTSFFQLFMVSPFIMHLMSHCVSIFSGNICHRNEAETEVSIITIPRQLLHPNILLLCSHTRVQWLLHVPRFKRKIEKNCKYTKVSNVLFLQSRPSWSSYYANLIELDLVTRTKWFKKVVYEYIYSSPNFGHIGS